MLLAPQKLRGEMVEPTFKADRSERIARIHRIVADLRDQQPDRDCELVLNRVAGDNSGPSR